MVTLVRNTHLRNVAYLKPVMKLARKQGFIAEDPFENLHFETPENNRIRYLSKDEEERLYAVLTKRDAELRRKRASHNKWLRERGHNERPEIPVAGFGDYMHPLIALGQHSGMRRREMLRLRWSFVNFERRFVTVAGATAKSKKTRHIPLNDFLLETLSRWQSQSEHTGTDDFVFPNDKGKPLDSVTTAWDTVREAAGLDDFRFHDLRHDFASKLVMAGVPLNTVRELMGHATLAMTLRYAHLSPQNLAEAVAKLPQRTYLHNLRERPRNRDKSSKAAATSR